MKSADEIRSTLAKYKSSVFRDYKVRSIALFGSYARNEQREGSDIDLLVDFKEDADLFDLTGLGLFLEEKLKEKVDIIPRNALRKELKRGVLKEALPT